MGSRISGWIKKRRIPLVCCIIGIALFVSGIAVGALLPNADPPKETEPLGGSFSGYMIRNIRIIASGYQGIGPETWSDPFVAEMRLFPYGYAPAGWLVCDGQTVPFTNTYIPMIVLLNFMGTIVRDAPAPIPDYTDMAPVPENATGGNPLLYGICYKGDYPPMQDEWTDAAYTMERAAFRKTSGEISEYFIGEIQLVAADQLTEATDWLSKVTTCDGRALKVNDYPALFSLIGTKFGGDGKTTFNLPDLRGQSPVEGYEYAIYLTGLYPARP